MNKRQLVLCFDGTNNNLTGGRADTNVVKLCEVLSPSPEGQVLYYDPGVGNPGNIPGVTWADKLRGKAERLWGLALGKGVYENIANAYIFLMRNRQPGDDIYVFVSRGAFTARSLAGMVARFGIMRPAMEEMVPTLLHLYFANPQRGKQHYAEIQKQIGESFCTAEGAQAPVWFVGVWDTVESVGAPFSRRKIRASATIIGKRFHHVRQALALDEHRRSFTPRPYYIHPAFNYEAAGQSIQQQWWSGSHCDIGGGYSEPESELSDHSFLWMLEEAVGVGLQVPARMLTVQGTLDRAAVASALRGASPARSRPALVHSETFNNAYWALTGLRVRAFDQAWGNPGDPKPAAPVEHAPPKPLQMPKDTVWRKMRARHIFSALALGFAFWVLHGIAISGHGLHVGRLGADLAQLGTANGQFAYWQIAWWYTGWNAVAQLPFNLSHPIWAVWADLGLIACYGYILACGLARGFAHWARLRKPGDPPPHLLNALGCSGAVIVGADLIEDALMLLALGTHWLRWPIVSNVWAALMSTACAVKWIGVLPALILISRAYGERGTVFPKRPGSQPGAA
jgi:hypothetical protein